jgi:hypothetical protein
MLASPRLVTLPGYLPELLFAATHRRCNPTNTTSCSLQTPRVAPWPAAALVLPAVVFRAHQAILAATRAPPRPPRTPPTASTLWQNRLNYSGSSALMIAMQLALTQRTSNGTIHGSVRSPPDTTAVQQDRSRFTSYEGEFTIIE